MSKRVLVVDDHAPTRSFIRTVLQRSDVPGGVEVIEAANGDACLRAVDQTPTPFDLIYLDIEMPDMDGFSVCRSLRAWKVTSPIVFVTGRGALRDFNAAREAGGDSYVVKPLSRAAVLKVFGVFTNLSRRDRDEETTP